MIVKMAWKNIWRNKLRSSVVIVSIVLGLWAAAFIFAYVFGIMEQRLNNAIGYEVSHMQLHHPDYKIDNESKYYITESSIDSLKTLDVEGVKAFSSRVLSFGMVNSPKQSSGAKIVGIDPDRENAVTQLSSLVTEGEYLKADDKNKILIGRKLAEKLDVRLGSKIVLTFQDLDYNIVSGAFRIKGIYDAINASIEDMNLYVNGKDLSRIMRLPEGAHELAILLEDSRELEPVKASLVSAFPAMHVEAWYDLSPELGIMIGSVDQYMIIFLVIILLALSFGIINTMLMAVLERVREIGVLKSIGMNNLRVFFMIFLETVFIIAIATPIGLGLAYFSIEYLGHSGIDISALAKDAYAEFGIESMVYPRLQLEYYWRILGMVAITAILASIYPSITAIKLDPVKAIRKI